MGVIAQRSRNLSLRSIMVSPPPGGRRIVSTTADATHFVNCTGTIEIVNCLFEQQKDDATNIHGLSAKITRILAPDQFEITMVHPQQAGIDFIKPGTRLGHRRGVSKDQPLQKKHPDREQSLPGLQPASAALHLLRRRLDLRWQSSRTHDGLSRTRGSPRTTLRDHRFRSGDGGGAPHGPSRRGT